MVIIIVVNGAFLKYNYYAKINTKGEKN